MKRFVFAVAAAIALLAVGGTARAAGPLNGTVPTGVYTPAAADGIEARYGVLPWLRKGFFFKSGGGCAGCGQQAQGGCGGVGQPGCGPIAPVGAGVPGYPQQGQPGAGMPGTLVFPNHPFARSPRDFFMTEK